ERGDRDDVRGVEVGHGDLALERRLPEIRPLRDLFLHEIGPVRDRIHVSPRADVVVAAERFFRDVLAGRELGQVELLVEPVGDVETRDVRGREVQVDQRVPLGHAGLGQPVDGAAHLVLHRDAGLRREGLADDPVDRVLPVAAPHSDDQRVLRARGRDNGRDGEEHEQRRHHHDPCAHRIPLSGPGTLRRRLRLVKPTGSSDNSPRMDSIRCVPFPPPLPVLIAVVTAAAEARAQGLRHFRDAHAASQRGDYDTAIRDYTLAIDAGDLPYPDSFFAFNNRANAYAAKRDWEHAVQDYSEALRRNPKFAAARRNRGLAYSRKGDHELAIQDFTEAARLDPDDPHALIYRGAVYCDRRAFDRAIRDFDAALVLCPTCPGAVNGRAAAAAGRDCR